MLHVYHLLLSNIEQIYHILSFDVLIDMRFPPPPRLVIINNTAMNIFVRVLVRK